MSSVDASVAVVGTGGIGSVLAGALRSAGADLLAVDLCSEHVEAITVNGLEVTGPEGTVTSDVVAATRLQGGRQFDLVILATKSGDLEAAARSVIAAGAVGAGTAVLTLQNGLGTLAALESDFGGSPVVRGTVGRFGAQVVAPGRVRHEGAGVVGLGPNEFGDWLPGLFETAGIAVVSYESVERLVWEKLVCNAGFSGVCAVHGATIGEVMADPGAWRRASGCAAEAYALGSSLGVEFDYADPVEHLRDFGASIAGARPSMLLDIEADRATEVDAINGGVAALAGTVGLGAPFNAVVAQQVKAREHGMGPVPLGDLG